MKLRLLVILCFVSALLSGTAFAQCTPDLTITIPGIYPDSATGLPPGLAGQPYSEVIQARVLTDTVYNGFPAIISNITITGVTGLPPGLTYSCNPASCVFPGGSNGCLLLSGTPTVAGIYSINVDLDINGNIFGAGLTVPQSLDYYVIEIGTVGLADNLSDIKFELLQNTPNPASDYTDVSFTSPIGGDFTIKLFNMIGKEVFQKTIRGMAGLNTSRIQLDEYTPGIYMLSLENGSSVATRRMIVSRK